MLDRHCVRCHYLAVHFAGGDFRRDSGPVKLLGKPGMSVVTGDRGKVDAAFSLLAREVTDRVAKRRWSESYLALTQSKAASVVGGPACYVGRPGEMVNWVPAQSPPTMLPPYCVGAAKSRLVKLVEDGHGGERLSAEEMAKLACWIDLAVPFCGDYREANAWSEDEKALYERFLRKRQGMTQTERANVEALIADRAAARATE